MDVPDPAARAVDLRSAMRLFPTGVALLCAGNGERAVGMTINALMSVSLTPPRILVSVLDTARAHPVLCDSGSYTVHLLSDRQAATAGLFASRDKPRGAELETLVEREVRPAALATLRCSVEQVFRGGDHSLFLSRVESVGHGAESGEPLLFHRGTLGSKRQ
ncbi:flavin reductase family protein [Streptomyces actinomycinicus]|uniref:Flavin reductase family protein n=1 Tax=Streptomyces actinomycinicus TaxID=1695166 RepID=A0A937ET48_9ACTN|nr:flavin reductase family protein [Streptomyces actinomycinicus]MBL1087620.1 flavin reductase family protein [Streptomyces actinomycinicus]